MLPFKEIAEGSSVIREFKGDTDSGEFTWHRDREDRIVASLAPTDWGIQLDNELPKKLEGEILIPMGVWHRVIKGTGDLKVRIKRIKN
jgi:hypothetical protein